MNAGGATVADGALNTPPTAGTTTGVTAAAYTNNDLDASTATTLFDLNTTSDQVVVQSPANSGQLAPTGGFGVNAGPAARRPSCAPGGQGPLRPDGCRAAGPDEWESLMQQCLVEEGLRRLSEDHRVALRETHLVDRPYAEVAAELGIPESPLRSRVFYGLKALRVGMEEMEVLSRAVGATPPASSWAPAGTRCSAT